MKILLLTPNLSSLCQSNTFFHIQICYKKEQTMATNYQPEEIDKNNWPIVSRTWSYGNAGKQTG